MLVQHVESSKLLGSQLDRRVAHVMSRYIRTRDIIGIRTLMSAARYSQPGGSHSLAI